MTRVAEQHQSFIILPASPLVWAAHFTWCYATAAVWCAKQESPLVSLMTVRIAIAIYTVAALGAIAIIGWGRRHEPSDPSARHFWWWEPCWRSWDTPRRTDARDYHRLTNGPTPESPRVPMEELVPPSELPAAIIDSCSRCHGVDGLGRGTGAFPVLAGQRPQYLRASLEAYAKGKRHSGIMEPMAAALGVEERREIADYYSGLGGAASLSPPGSGGEIERGRRIAHEGMPDKRVPACVTAMGPAAPVGIHTTRGWPGSTRITSSCS